jgi:hypothetical protein
MWKWRYQTKYDVFFKWRRTKTKLNRKLRVRDFIKKSSILFNPEKTRVCPFFYYYPSQWSSYYASLHKKPFELIYPLCLLFSRWIYIIATCLWNNLTLFFVYIICKLFAPFLNGTFGALVVHITNYHMLFEHNTTSISSVLFVPSNTIIYIYLFDWQLK